MLRWLLKRLGEPSTMAGVSALAQAAYGALYMGVPLSVAIPAGVAGLLGVVLRERGAADTHPTK